MQNNPYIEWQIAVKEAQRSSHEIDVSEKIESFLHEIPNAKCSVQ